MIFRVYLSSETIDQIKSLSDEQQDTLLATAKEYLDTLTADRMAQAVAAIRRGDIVVPENN